MSKISLKGIVIGSLADIISTSVLVTFLLIYMLISRDVHILSPKDTKEALKDIIKIDQLFYNASLLLGSFCSILGGYIAARIAGHDELLNGTLASFLCVVGSLYALLSGSPLPHSLLAQLFWILVSITLSLFGGYLRLKQVHRKA